MFDDALLDDQAALTRADLRLRGLAEGGARVRREAVAAAEVIATSRDRLPTEQPRAVVAVGPDSRLLRAVLEPDCPVPFVAWPGAGLPGWVGSLDLVVVLSPEGNDPQVAATTADAVRRGCQVIVLTPAASLVAEHASGRYTTVIPVQTRDQTAIALVALDLLSQLHLGPQTNIEYVARALDEVAIDCSPYRDSTTNPAKILAMSLADSDPALWGTSPLAARAARRIAEALRAATGRSALAGVADQLRPMLEAAEPVDVFADPFDDGPAKARPVLVVVDDGNDDPHVRAELSGLVEAAERRGVRIESIDSQADDALARYAAMMLTGHYTAAYLQIAQAPA